MNPSIQILEPGDEARLESFLRQHVDSSLILLSNLRQGGLVDQGKPFEGTYYAALSSPSEGGDGEVLGVIAHYCWVGNLILQAPSHVEEILERILAAPACSPRKATERPIRGLLGLSGQVGQAKRLLGWGDDEVQLDEEEGLYALALDELIVPEDLHHGSLRGRRAEARDLNRVSAWRVAYCVEGLGAEETPELVEQSRADMAGSIERGTTWVLEEVRGEARPVATSSFNATIRETVQIGGVWTPPENRGRGYGRAAVAASLLDARAEGVERAVLFTGDDNVPALRAYAALGFQRIGDHRIVLLR